jgi:hypothetical protein
MGIGASCLPGSGAAHHRRLVHVGGGAFDDFSLVAGENGLEHFAGDNQARADLGIDIVVFLQLEALEHAGDGFFGEFVIFLTENFLQHCLAERHIFVALLVADIFSDMGCWPCR